MSVAYKKIDNGDFWVYRERLSTNWKYAVFVIGLGLYIGLGTISKSASGWWALIYILFLALYGLSTIPVTIARSKALAGGKEVTQKKINYVNEIWIKK